MRYVQLLRSSAIVVSAISLMPLAGGASGGVLRAEQARQSVTATVTFGPRITLQVSSQVLHFHVTDPSAAAVTSVDFALGGRTRKGGDVQLLVEVVDPLAPGAPYALTIVGGSDGVAAGALAHDVPHVVARWLGGGFRSGRVTFRLDAAPGRYDVPVTFLVKVSDSP
jgi:hypothetical protein